LGITDEEIDFYIQTNAIVNKYMHQISFITSTSDDIVTTPENVCVICFEHTDKKQALISYGHRDFCLRCITKIKICPMRRLETKNILVLH